MGRLQGGEGQLFSGNEKCSQLLYRTEVNPRIAGLFSLRNSVFLNYSYHSKSGNRNMILLPLQSIIRFCHLS